MTVTGGLQSIQDCSQGSRGIQALRAEELRKAMSSSTPVWIRVFRGNKGQDEKKELDGWHRTGVGTALAPDLLRVTSSFCPCVSVRGRGPFLLSDLWST